MKLIKRIFYIIFGLLIASAVSLVGLILYSEYSGRQLWKSFGEETADAGFPEEESRLAYDENGNLAELPGSSQPIATEAAAQSDFFYRESGKQYFCRRHRCLQYGNYQYGYFGGRCFQYRYYRGKSRARNRPCGRRLHRQPN